MKRGLQRLLSRLSPIIVFAIAILTLSFGLVLIAYLILFGFTLGFCFYLYNLIRSKLVRRKKAHPPRKTGGRVIDSDDYKELK